jgi:uncharacterized protein involved in exopolysaccharide biosynthesis
MTDETGSNEPNYYSALDRLDQVEAICKPAIEKLRSRRSEVETMVQDLQTEIIQVHESTEKLMNIQV